MRINTKTMNSVTREIYDVMWGILIFRPLVLKLWEMQR